MAGIFGEDEAYSFGGNTDSDMPVTPFESNELQAAVRKMRPLKGTIQMDQCQIRQVRGDGDGEIAQTGEVKGTDTFHSVGSNKAVS